MRLADILTDDDARAVSGARWRVVGERDGRRPTETVCGSMSQAVAHADLRHRVGGCHHVAILEERYSARGPAHPWPVWLLVDGGLLSPQEVQAEIVRGCAADWCIPGDIAQMDTYRPT